MEILLLFPNPGAKQEDVDKRVLQIDTEWNKELHRGHPKKYGKLCLSDKLNDTQELALIDAVHTLKRGLP